MTFFKSRNHLRLVLYYVFKYLDSVSIFLLHPAIIDCNSRMHGKKGNIHDQLDLNGVG